MAGKMAGEYLHEWVEGSGKSGVSQALKRGVGILGYGRILRIGAGYE